MAKPNYSMAKRQRDLAKKAKAEEKRLRKAQALESGKAPEADDDDVDVDDTGGEETPDVDAQAGDAQAGDTSNTTA